MKPRTTKSIANSMWAGMAAFFFLIGMDSRGYGISGPLRLVSWALAAVCFASYGGIVNEYFLYPVMKSLCHYLVPRKFSPAFIPRVMDRVEAYHKGSLDLKGLVEATVVQVTQAERLAALEYLCLLGVPEESIATVIPNSASDELRADIGQVFKKPSWGKVYSLTALVTMASLLALVLNFAWAKALLAAPTLAALRMLIGEKWFKS